MTATDCVEKVTRAYSRAGADGKQDIRIYWMDRLFFLRGKAGLGDDDTDVQIAVAVVKMMGEVDGMASKIASLVQSNHNQSAGGLVQTSPSPQVSDTPPASRRAADAHLDDNAEANAEANQEDEEQ